MKLFCVGLAAAFGLFATAAAAQTTYYVESAPYTSASNFTACPLGGCSVAYTTSQRLSGSFTILGALAPNLVDEVIDVRLGDLDLNDGQNSFQTDFSGFGIVPQTAQISTDAGGNLTYFEFKFDRIHGTPVAAGAPANPRSYVTSVYFGRTPGGSFAYVETNSLCTSRGDNVGGNTFGLGCATQLANAAQGASSASAPSVTISTTPPVVPAVVPTLSEWAMIFFGGLLAMGAAFHLHRRRTFIG